MPATNGFEILVDQLERLLWLFHQSQRNKVRGEMTIETVSKIKALLFELAQSPQVGLALGVIGQIGRDRMQDQLEEAQLNPCATIEPTQHLRNAYGAFDRAVTGLRAFTGDHRFWPSLRRPLPMRVPLYEVNAQIVSLKGSLFGASLHANRATVEILGMRDPRAPLGARPAELPPAILEAPIYLIHLPDKPFASEHETVKSLRQYLFLVSEQFCHAAKRGRKRLDDAAVDKAGQMVEPDAIPAALVDLNYFLLSASLTCSALSRLAAESPQM